MAYYFRLSKTPEEDDILVMVALYKAQLVPPVDPEKEALKQRIVAALIVAEPAFSVTEFGFAEIAQARGISEEEARRFFRHIEINGPELIQITLYDNSVTVLVPLYKSPASATRAFEKILSYLQIIAREAGYGVYDEQIAKVVDLSSGLEESIECYRSGVNHFPGLI